MKKFLTILIVLIIVVLLLIGLDTGIGYLRKTHPLISWSNTIENGKVDYSLFYDVYTCYNLGEVRSIEITSRKKSYTCPESDIILTKNNLNVYSYNVFYSKKKYIRRITSNDELKNYTKNLTNYTKKYDDEFFNKKSILMINLPNTTNTKVTFNEVYISDEVTVKFNTETAKGTNKGYVFFIEIDNSYLGDKELDIEL